MEQGERETVEEERVEITDYGDGEVEKKGQQRGILRYILIPRDKSS